MKISTRSVYALKAVLTLASRYGESPLSAHEIAKELGIPAAYLEQIFFRLRKEKWVQSIRGSRGGYRLVKPPAEVTVADVLRVLDEAPRSAGLPSRGDSSHHAELAYGVFAARFHQTFRELLERSSLKSLLDESRKVSKGVQKKSKSQIHFNI